MRLLPSDTAMGRLFVALLAAIVAHALLFQLPISSLQKTPPRLSGRETITISLTHTAKPQQEGVPQIIEPQSPPLDAVAPLPLPDLTQPLDDPAASAAVPEPVPKEREKPPVQVKALQRKKKVAIAKEKRQHSPQDKTEEVRDLETAPAPERVHQVPSTLSDRTAVPATPSIIEAKPLYKQNPKPVYPDLARRRGMEGTVILRVMVEESGTASSVEIHSSSGHTLLDKAALQTVIAWQFIPGSKNGQPCSMEVLVPVQFKLQ